LPDLLSVEQDLVVRAGGEEGIDDLVRHVGAQVDREGEVGVDLADEVAELLRALELVLLEPLLDHLRTLLLQHELAELESLGLIQLARLQQRAEVLQQRTRLPRLHGNVLELLDRRLRAQRLPRARRERRRALDVAHPQKVVELPLEEIRGAGEVGAPRQPDAEINVVQVGAHVRHDGVLVDGEGEHLALAVDAEDATSGERRGDKDRVGRDAVHVDARSRLDVVKVDVAELGDHVNHAVLLRDLHRHGEVGLPLRGVVHVDLRLLKRRRRVAALRDFDHVKLRADRAARGEREERGRGGGTGDGELGEAAGMPFNRLRHTLVYRVQLHRAGDLAIGALGDAHEAQPLLGGVGSVVDDLGAGERRVAVEDFLGVGRVVHVPMVHGRLRHERERARRHPLPENDVVIHLHGLYLRLLVDVENLESVASLQCKQFLCRVHDRGISADWPARQRLRVRKIDDDNLHLLSLLTHADEFLRLHRQVGKCDRIRVDPQRR